MRINAVVGRLEYLRTSLSIAAAYLCFRKAVVAAWGAALLFTQLATGTIWEVFYG